MSLGESGAGLQLGNMFEKVVWVNDQVGRNAKVEAQREFRHSQPATPLPCMHCPATPGLPCMNYLALPCPAPAQQFHALPLNKSTTLKMTSKALQVHAPVLPSSCKTLPWAWAPLLHQLILV